MKVRSCAATVKVGKLAASLIPSRKMITEQEIRTCLINWQNKPYPQVVEELSSLSVESLGAPDNYYFLFWNGRFVSPETGAFVYESIDRHSFLGQREYRAFLELESWAEKSTRGAAVWISPKFEGKYDTSKIIVSEIVSKNGQKAIENSSILLNLSDSECLEAARKMGLYLEDVEELRESIIVLPEDGSAWVDVVEAAVGENVKLFDEIRNNLRGNKNAALSLARGYQQMIEIGVDPMIIYQQMQRDRFLGTNEISCPATASEISFRQSRIFGEKTLECDCPYCGKHVNAKISMGQIHCPNCGRSAPYLC